MTNVYHMLQKLKVMSCLLILTSMYKNRMKFKYIYMHLSCKYLFVHVENKQISHILMPNYLYKPLYLHIGVSFAKAFMEPLY